jgi:protein TonB
MVAGPAWAEEPTTAPSVGCKAETQLPDCTCERPVYPPDAARQGEQGRTTVRISVNAEGRVTDVEMLVSSGSRKLDRATVEHFRKVCFNPARDAQGHPVPAKAQVEYVWRLQ